MLHPWIKDKINSQEITSIRLGPLTKGRNILIAPEGLGKSREVLNQVVQYGSGKYVYSTHTKANAREKADALRTLKHVHHIRSDSEIFEDAIRRMDPTLADALALCSSKAQTLFMNVRMYSVTKSNGNMTRLAAWGPGVNEKRLEKCRYRSDDYLTYKFNYDVNGDIQRRLAGSQYKDYFMFYRKDTIEQLLAVEDESILGDSIKSLGNIVSELNVQISETRWKCVRITPEARAFIRHEKAKRDEILKKASTCQDPCLLIAQDKTTDIYITPRMNNIQEWTLIQDELTQDIFSYRNIDDAIKINHIAGKVWEHGIEHLDQEERIYSIDQGIYSTFKEIDAKSECMPSFGSMELTLHFFPGMTGHEGRFGDVKLCQRLSEFENALVLTAESVYPLFLTKYGYTISEISPDYRVADEKFKICISDENTIAQIVTGDDDKRNTVKDFIEYHRTNHNVVTIGTSAFGSEFTMEACKGLNINMDRNLEKVIYAKNPYPKNYFKRILTTYKTLFNDSDVTKDDVEGLQSAYVTDILNQALGRFCGHRDDGTVEKVLFLHHTDILTLEALKHLRYQGVDGDFDAEFNTMPRLLASPHNDEWDTDVFEVALGFGDVEVGFDDYVEQCKENRWRQLRRRKINQDNLRRSTIMKC